VATTPSCELTEKQQEANRLLAGPQTHTLLVGGSRSGKTFLGTRAVTTRAVRVPESRHVIFRLRFNALRASVWLDTLPKVMRLCFPGVPYKNNRQDGYISLPNKSEIWFAGLDDKDRVEKILGMEFATLYFNECSQIPRASVLTALTRLAQKVDGLRNRAYYDLNPVGTGHWTYRQFIEHLDPDSRQPLANPDDYRHIYMNPADNRANVDEGYLRLLESLPERQRRRFLDGRYVAEIDGALWTLELLEKHRRDAGDVPLYRRVVVAVDPSGSKGEEDKRSDEIGIVVAALGVDDRVYVLADLSGRYSPEQWGAIAARAWTQYGADRIVGERNFGGDMVRAIVHAADRNAPYKEVTASRGKVVRAEPVSALYEQGRVSHVGRFGTLEDQQCNFSTSGYLGDKSPDRADALVWAITELVPVSTDTGLLDFYRQQAERLRASEN
jgi:phage terminase large subunit-like protein